MRIVTWTLLAVALAVAGVARLDAADDPTATGAATAQAPSAVSEGDDEAVIRSNAAKYVESYNRRDSKTMASMWSPDAVYVDSDTGERFIGRDDIAKHFDWILAGSEDAQLSINIDGIDFVSPNVAIETGTAHVEYGKGEPEDTTYSAVHVKRDGQWYLDRVTEEETPEPPPSHYDQLKELDWLVGSWIDSDENATIETDCEWTKNKNFLRRSFAVAIGDQINMSGMQIIGWDAADKKFRSWVFDSEGGFSAGVWTNKGDRWFIQTNGVLADGRRSSGINVLTKVDDDSYKWQTINREVDGEMLPNVDEVLIVRAPADATDSE